MRRSDSCVTWYCLLLRSFLPAFYGGVRHQGAGVLCWAGASTPARAGRSPRERGRRRGSATGVAWGMSGSCLQPFRLLGQQGAASSYVETPT